MNACACMGIKPGDEYCYCGLVDRGMDTSKYNWSEEEIALFHAALDKMIEENKNGD